MMLGIDRDLDIVAHDTGASAAGRHRTGIGIRQRDLLVWRGEHVHLENLKPLHLLLQLRNLLFQTARLDFECLGRLLPVGGVDLLAYMEWRKKRMYWTTPTLIEICIGLEINGYLPAEF